MDFYDYIKLYTKQVTTAIAGQAVVWLLYNPTSITYALYFVEMAHKSNVQSSAARTRW